MVRDSSDASHVNGPLQTFIRTNYHHSPGDYS